MGQPIGARRKMALKIYGAFFFCPKLTSHLYDQGFHVVFYQINIDNSLFCNIIATADIK